jgi:hypothetical protein
MQRRTFRPSDFSRQSSSASLLTASLTRRSVESYIWLLKRCFHQTRGDWRALHAWRANGRVAKIKKVLIGSTPNSRSCCRSFQARREGRAIDSRCGAACEAFRPRDSPVGARGYRCSSHGATGMLLGIGKSGLLTKPTFSLWALRASAYEGGEPALSTLSCRSMWSGSRPESRQPPDV